MRFSIKHIVAKNWVFIVLILVAAFLRFYQFEGFVIFLGDQGRDAMIVRDIVTFRHFPAIGAPSSIGQIYLGPFYYYLIAPFLLLFNFHPAGLAFGVALISLIGLGASYFVIKKEENTFVAFTFLAFTTVSIILIYLARFSWNPNLLPYFSFFTLYFFTKLIQEKKALYGLLFGAFLSFSIQLHHLALLLLLPIGLIFIFSLIKKHLKLTQLKSFGFSLISFFFFSSPLLVFDLKHEFLNTKNFIKLITEEQVVGHVSLWEEFMITIQAFFQHVFQLQFSQIEALILFTLVLTFTVILFIKSKFSSQLFLKINSLSVVLYVITFSLLNSSRFIHYYGAIYLSFFFIFAAILNVVKNTKLKYILAILCFAMFCVPNFQKNYFLYGKTQNQIEHAKTMADSFKGKIKKQPIQLVTEPFTESDGHIRYFLKVAGYQLIDHDSPAMPEELFLLCFNTNCRVLGNSQYQIASFSVKPPTITAQWSTLGVKIYKLSHE